MKRPISDYENEIVHQIILIELCFSACKEIPIIAGIGNHFNYYFFNLNMHKGISSLHSLLNPTGNEISINGYLSEYRAEISKKDGYNSFQKDIKNIKNDFKALVPNINIRHKVIAHLDHGFKHSDFTCAYLLPEKLDGLIQIISALKNKFFELSGWAQNDGHSKILRQVKLAIKGASNKND